MKHTPTALENTDVEGIVSLIDGFKNQKVLIIGDVMLDSYLWGKVDRISPEAPVPVVAVKKRENRLGGAANVALNIQSLGAIPIICSVVGNDPKGQQLTQLLGENQMISDGVVLSNHRLTTVKFRIMGNNTQLLRVDEESEEDILPEETQQLLAKISKWIESGEVQVIVFEDYDKGVITPKLIDAVVELAKAHRIPIVVDPKKKNFMHYKGVTLFKPNLKELREGLKLEEEPNTPEKLHAACSMLSQQLHAPMILATLSDKGIYFCQQGNDGQMEYGHFAAQVRKISDVSGAGDTVVSVAALCLASGASLAVAAWLANIAGGIVCEHAGVVPINRQELINQATEELSS